MEYPKIQTMYLRDPATKYKTLLEGQWARPEFEYLKGNTWEWTEKVDGTNVRVVWDGSSLSFKGKTDNSQFPTFLYDELSSMFERDLFDTLYRDEPMILYGEGYGAKIQKGGGNYIPDGVSFILFDVLIDGFWLKREDVKDIAERLGVLTVPIIGYGSLMGACSLARDGFISWIAETPGFMAEGLVMRPEIGLFNRRGDRIITKIKHKDFAE